MPRSRLVTSDDWPEAELRGAVLAGELVAVGPCWSSPAEPQTPSLRASAAAWVFRDDRLIACTGTAAWIWGAVSRAPSPLDACTPSQVRVRADGEVHLREVVIADAESVLLGGLRVTTPTRTALDLLRAPNHAGVGFPPAAAAGVGGLLSIGAVTGEELAGCLGALGTIPMARQAERRLAALVRSVGTQPALTRYTS